MYELGILLAQATQVVSCNSNIQPPVVCNKRAGYIGKQYIYRITLTGKTQEFQVNRCTYLANKIGKPFVYEADGKWCKKEKELEYTSIWIY